MARLHESLAALIVLGDALVPDEITAILGCAPNSSFSKGQIFHSKSGDIVRKTGMWRLEADNCAPADLDKQVASVLRKLSQDLGVWSSLSSKYKIEFFCGLFMQKANEGLNISPETLQRLGERGILLGLDIYMPTQEAGNGVS